MSINYFETAEEIDKQVNPNSLFPLKEMYVNGFTWQRTESPNTITWCRLSRDISLQGMTYAFYKNTQRWYFHVNSETKPTIVSMPEIEQLYQNQYN